MKKIVTLIAGAALAATLTTAAYAQAAGPAGGTLQNGGAQKQGEHRRVGQMQMLKKLDLTKEQQKQIKELAIKFSLKGKEQNPADKVTKEDRKKMMERRQEFMKEIVKILTPEQNAKLKKMLEEAKSKAGDRAGRRNKNGGGAAGSGTTKSGGGGN